MKDDSSIIEVLMYFIPAAIVLLAVYMLIKKFLDNDYKLRLLEVKRLIQKDVIPLRLQAYERICLFLERISPNNLLVRVHKSGMSAKELQSDLIFTIRSEYEHNLSQQLYVSSSAWEIVKGAKEEVIKIINMAFIAVGDKASGIELSKAIFDSIVKNEKAPTRHALDFIKNEIRQIL